MGVFKISESPAFENRERALRCAGEKLIAGREDSRGGCLFMCRPVCGGARVRSGPWVAVETAWVLSCRVPYIFDVGGVRLQRGSLCPLCCRRWYAAPGGLLI